MKVLERSPLLLAGCILLVACTYLFLRNPLNFFYNTNTEDDEPCKLIDTVNLTGYKQFPNGSYLYENTIIPPNLWKVYEHTIKFSERVSAEPHVRGCICKLKPCVKFCCPITQRIDSEDNMSCGDLIGLNYTTQMNVTKINGDTLMEDLTKTFSIQNDLMCPDMFFLTPEQYPEDAYILFENGALLVNNEYSMTKDQYCLDFRDGNGSYFPNPRNCSQYNYDNERRALATGYTMCLSVPFFIMTIFVYLSVPKLRTLHGKTLCCYLIGLTLAYSVLSFIIFAPPKYMSDSCCKFVGYFVYYWLMAAFCWLSVISFNLYYKICRPHGKFHEFRQFKYFSIYAWGLAFVLLCLTFTADETSLIPNEWKPLINNNNRCYFSASGWAAMIYLYVPMLIIIAFSITMFIRTAHKIYNIRKEMAYMVKRKETTSFRDDKDLFGVYLRLFIVMGVTWSVEIIPYLMGTNSSWISLQYIFDFINSFQGVIIFALFVLKKKVKRAFIKRFLPSNNSESQSQSSTKTQFSSDSIQLQSVHTEAEK